MLGRVLDKHTLHELAQCCGVPQPRTWSFPSLADMAADVDALPFPCVVKLEVDSLDLLPAGLQGTLRHRVSPYKIRNQLQAWTDLALRCGFDSPVLVQEFIPGGAETLYTLTSYTNREGTLLAGAVGHKIRQAPPDAGGITVGRIAHVDEVFEHGSRFLKAIGFHGLANTEFKYDARDGSYRLMEINPRLGVWNYSTLIAGINLPMIAYRDMQGKEYNGPRFTRQVDGTLWMNTLPDLMNCVRDYRILGFTDHHLGFRRWAASIRGPKVDAVWSLKDPLPGIVYTARFVRTKAANVLKNAGKRR
jgi:predicted ATP-grasp superfamily ATP-dependent carboligase